MADRLAPGPELLPFGEDMVGQNITMDESTGVSNGKG
jgi:hypothetical protein